MFGSFRAPRRIFQRHEPFYKRAGGGTQVPPPLSRGATGEEAYTVKYATDQIVEVEQISSLLYVKPGGNLQEPERDELVEVRLPE